MKLNSLKQKSAVIVIHESSGGPGHDLRDFLLEHKTNELLFIAHPLLYLSEHDKSSRFEFYKNGKLVEEGKAFHWVLPESLLYFKDFIYTVFWSYKLSNKIDLFFGVNNLNTISGLFLKKILKIKKVIYYVIDYAPNRFSNKVLNHVYHFVEKLAAEKSSLTWNLSPRMIEGREKKWGIKFINQIVVPHGVHIERIKEIPFNKVHKHEIIFMGNLLEKQGVQLVISALPEIIKTIKDVNIVIIGRGSYEKELKNLVRKLKISEHVNFMGYIDDHNEVENRIAEAGMALALYDPSEAAFSYYADPGKIKNYLGAGVPVIMTDVPQIARDIEKEKCGIIVEYDGKKLSDKVINFLKKISKTKRYRVNARRFAEKYSWKKVFERGLKHV